MALPQVRPESKKRVSSARVSPDDRCCAIIYNPLRLARHFVMRRSVWRLSGTDNQHFISARHAGDPASSGSWCSARIGLGGHEIQAARLRIERSGSRAGLRFQLLDNLYIFWVCDGDDFENAVAAAWNESELTGGVVKSLRPGRGRSEAKRPPYRSRHPALSPCRCRRTRSAASTRVHRPNLTRRGSRRACSVR
jgi:hypothetical protein